MPMPFTVSFQAVIADATAVPYGVATTNTVVVEVGDY
jgi:hypothetical protein